MEYRGLSKLKSTYTDKLPEMIDARTGRVHTSYHQAVTATGRLSSSDLTFRTFPFVPRKVGVSVRPLSRHPAAKLSRPITHRSNCASWRTSRRTRDCSMRLPMSWTCTVPPLLRCLGSRLMRSPGPAAQSEGDQFGLIYGMSAFGLANSWVSAGMRRRSISICILPVTPGWQITWRGPVSSPTTPGMWKR